MGSPRIEPLARTTWPKHQVTTRFYLPCIPRMDSYSIITFIDGPAQFLFSFFQMAKIPVQSEGGTVYALIDEADLPAVQKHKWHIYQEYVATELSKVEGKKRFIRLHRFLIPDVPFDHVVDHKDGDKLNNQRSNLRVCTRTENARNRKKWRSKVSSSYKGVFLVANGKYQARIFHDEKDKRLGTFATELEAAHAYDAAARLLHGEYARLNFPEPSSVVEEVKGLTRKGDQWQADIEYYGKIVYLGLYPTKETAATAYEVARKALFDVFVIPDEQEPVAKRVKVSEL